MPTSRADGNAKNPAASASRGDRAASTLRPFGRGERASLAGRTILQIIPRLDAGGAERTTIDVAAALVRGRRAGAGRLEGGRLASELQAVGGVLTPFPAATKNPLSMALNVRRLARLIVEERVDLVHARSRAPAWVALGGLPDAHGRSSPPITAPMAGDRRSS